MQLLGLILLLASSWYLWKLTSNFLDEPTKKELTNSLNNLKNKFSEGKQNFSKAKISEAWEKYKEEGGALSNKEKKLVDFFIITGLTKDISRIDLIGILIGHLIFGVALTKLLDWTWLKNLMSEEDKTRMLKSYTWKDLLVDGAIVTVVLGIIFLIISIFL